MMVREYVELCKVRLSFFTALSSGAGFIAACREPAPPAIVLAAGVFLLACGSCALNQYQDRDIDRLMERTRNRPMPSGRVSPTRALLFSSLLLCSGSAALFITANFGAFLLGLIALFWYNGVYTPLKRKSAFAAVPGALTGAIPPAVGWVAGNGSIEDPRLLALSFFFFMWQVPHFWLHLAACKEEYAKAGLPSIAGIFTTPQYTRIVFLWLFAAAAASLFLILYGVVRSPAVASALIITSLWPASRGIALLRTMEDAAFGRAFRRSNLQVLLVMLLLSLDSLLA